MKLLTVEDEKQLADSLKKSFDAEGFETVVRYDGENGLEAISSQSFDLLLLDWRVPKVSGIEICKRVRESNQKVPIILLTALSDIKNKIEAFKYGADDYITKPFSFEEVLARINAVVRRSQSNISTIDFDDYSLNLINHTLVTPSEEIKLPDMEFELLKYFLENKSEIISREKLCEDVWKLPFTPSTNVVDVTVKNIRKKLEDISERKYIKTVYGEGYIFIA